jgi:hypothetical protein
MTTDFQLCFRVRNYDGTGKRVGNEIEWTTPPPDLCCWWESTGDLMDTINKNRGTFIDASKEVA